ncbi:MAG: MmoB/DmpM family protein [Terracidiphilus sp.]
MRFAGSTRPSKSTSAVLIPACSHHAAALTRRAIEDILGQSFDFRAELEIMMPSFKGRMRLDDDEAVWTFEDDTMSVAEASKTGRSVQSRPAPSAVQMPA